MMSSVLSRYALALRPRVACSIGYLTSAAALAACLAGCARREEPSPARLTAAKGESPLEQLVASAQLAQRAAPTFTLAKASADSPAPLVSANYPWLSDPTLHAPVPVDSLEGRFAPPQGFSRVPVEPGSFGVFLRGLPLASPDQPVLSFDGSVLLKATDPRVAAVVAIDIGKTDLQQCADSVMRLHAEWLWSQGRRDMSYRAANGQPLPLSRWLKGERVVPKGNKLEWTKSGAKARSDHSSFRKYLDTVFMWANTVSLSVQAQAIEPSALRPGDFWVLGGNPGHAVIVLDLARDPKGKLVALLGQGFMPAQSFHVLHAKRGVAWFELDPGGGDVDTPFWKPFPWSSLRRLPD